WTATYVLMGLRYERELIDRLLQGVIEMEESVTYQGILEKGEARGEAKGEVKEARRLVLLQGNKRFGPAPPEVTAALQAITDTDKLEQLGLRLLDVESWHELLGLPTA